MVRFETFHCLVEFFGLLFILCFTLPYIVTFTALRQWLEPAAADEPTAHVVPSLPRDAMRKRGLCCGPVSVRLSVYHVCAFYPDG